MEQFNGLGMNPGNIWRLSSARSRSISPENFNAAESEPANFPPTLLFNEGWLLRLVLDWYSRHKLTANPLLFQHCATWFSEALLPSPFRPRYRSDPRAEARTHVDGIVSHLSIGRSGKTDASLPANATRLIVIEAKIYSPLAGGTRNTPSFDQAARNFAGITELLSRANTPVISIPGGYHD